MKKLIVIAVLICGLAMYFLASQVVAQPKQESEELVKEEAQIAVGTVKSISADKIVISEYDVQSDKYVDAEYVIDSGSLKLVGVEVLAEIKAEDGVEIEYVVKDGKKIAQLITLD